MLDDDEDGGGTSKNRKLEKAIKTIETDTLPKFKKELNQSIEEIIKKQTNLIGAKLDKKVKDLKKEVGELSGV